MNANLLEPKISTEHKEAPAVSTSKAEKSINDDGWEEESVEKPKVVVVLDVQTLSDFNTAIEEKETQTGKDVKEEIKDTTTESTDAKNYSWGTRSPNLETDHVEVEVPKPVQDTPTNNRYLPPQKRNEVVQVQVQVNTSDEKQFPDILKRPKGAKTETVKEEPKKHDEKPAIKHNHPNTNQFAGLMDNDDDKETPNVEPEKKSQTIDKGVKIVDKMSPEYLERLELVKRLFGEKKKRML